MTSSNSAPSVRSPTGLPVSVHVMPHDSIDTAVIAAIVLAAFLFALWFFTAFRAGGGVPGFYQSEFGPGVMMACGRGFVNPRLDAAPALQAFLSTRADRFTCDTLPRLIPEMKLTYFQEAHRYLIASAGLVWRAVGIGWRHLDALAAMFFAVALGAGYVALRFVCGRLLSVLVISRGRFPRCTWRFSRISATIPKRLTSRCCWSQQALRSWSAGHGASSGSASFLALCRRSASGCARMFY